MLESGCSTASFFPFVKEKVRHLEFLYEILFLGPC